MTVKLLKYYRKLFFIFSIIWLVEYPSTSAIVSTFPPFAKTKSARNKKLTARLETAKSDDIKTEIAPASAEVPSQVSAPAPALDVTKQVATKPQQVKIDGATGERKTKND